MRQSVIRSVYPVALFIHHVGGDDFVLVVPLRAAEAAAQAIVDRFDSAAPSMYGEEERARGFVRAVDRRGRERHIPFVSVSIGIVPIAARHTPDAVALSRAAAEVKEVAKRRTRSSWAVDRRHAEETDPVR